MAYDPTGNGRDKAYESVRFVEAAPPEHLRSIVHRFLELRTHEPLPIAYRFHALPDACTYAVFDQMRPEVAGITRLQASSEELSLGKTFHFVNIRFLPGVWQREKSAPDYGMIDAPYGGDLPLMEVARDLAGQSFEAQQARLAAFVEGLMAEGLVVANPVTEAIFAHIDDIFSVADMAEVAGMSARQLQRVLKKTTGFSPHDFFKVLRLQQSLRGEPSLSYADQSHFIHSFKKATGYTPNTFAKKFDVRNLQ